MIRCGFGRQGELRVNIFEGHKYLKIKVKAREVGRRMKVVRHRRGIIGDTERSIAREASPRIVS